MAWLNMSRHLTFGRMLAAYPEDHGEASGCWLCVRNWELGVCGLLTSMVLETVGLWGVPITCEMRDRGSQDTNQHFSLNKQHPM